MTIHGRNNKTESASLPEPVAFSPYFSAVKKHQAPGQCETKTGPLESSAQYVFHLFKRFKYAIQILFSQTDAIIGYRDSD